MFSVVIPTKNEEKNIKRLLKNLRRQTLQPNQIIVADKSTDDTAKIAKSFGATVVEGVNNGKVGKGRNMGAKHVKSDWIVFLDADVILPDDFFEVAIPTVIEGDYDIATCKILADKKKLKNFLYFRSWHAVKKLGYYTKQILAECGACMIVKKKSFDHIDGFSEIIGVGEDADFVQRILKAGGKYKILPLKIQMSDRRFNKPMHKLAFQMAGLAGLAAITILGIGVLKKNRHRFEKLYGELGGKDKKK